MNSVKFFFIMALLFSALVGKSQIGIITTIAGNGTNTYTGDGGPATSAAIMTVANGVFDTNGNYYFAVRFANKIRKIESSGRISTIAGIGIGGYSGDGGAATNAKLNGPVGIEIDANNNLYVAEVNNNIVRKLELSTGIISTIAGTGAALENGDGGPATAASIYAPIFVCFNHVGDLFISDGDNRIRKVQMSTGIITTAAGIGGAVGFSGDGGPATAAQLYSPAGICSDSLNNLFIADHFNNRIRKVDATTGIITTIAGGALATYNGEGIIANAAQLNPFYLEFDHYGSLYISDQGNNRIRKIDLTNHIYTVIGNGIASYIGDGGPATDAEISHPEGLSFDVCGNLYVSDNGNYRIRKVTLPPILTTPTITISSTVTMAPIGTPITINAIVADAGSSYQIRWMNRGVQFATTTVPSVTYTKAAGRDTITARVVSTAAYGCYDSTTSAPKVITVSTTGATINVAANMIRVYPNPVNDVLHIDGVKKGQTYKVYSIIGAVLQAGVLSEGSNSVNIQKLPAGIYMVGVSGGDGVTTMTRIVKQ